MCRYYYSPPHILSHHDILSIVSVSQDKSRFHLLLTAADGVAASAAAMQDEWQGGSPGEGEEEDPSSLFHILDSLDGSVAKAGTLPLPLLGTPPPAHGGTAAASPLLRRGNSRRKANKELLQSSYSACKARINDLKLLLKTAPKKHRPEIDSAIKLYKLLSTMAYCTLIFSSINDLEVCTYALSKRVGDQLVNMREWSPVIEICKAEIRRKSESIVSFNTVKSDAATGQLVNANIVNQQEYNPTEIGNEMKSLKNDIETLKTAAVHEHEKMAVNMDNLRSQIMNLVKSEYSKQVALSPNKALGALREKNSKLEGEVASLNLKLTTFFKLKEESERKLVEKYELMLAQHNETSCDDAVACVTHTHIDNYESETNKYKELAASLSRDIATLRSSGAEDITKKALVADNDRLHGQLEESRAREASLETDISAGKIRLTSLEAELSTLRSSGAINEEHAKLRLDVEGLRRQLEISAGEGDATKQQLAAATEQAVELQGQVRSLLEETRHLKHALGQLHELQSHSDTGEQSSADTIDRLTLDLEMATNSNASLETENNAMKKRIELLKSEITSLESTISELSANSAKHHDVELLLTSEGNAATRKIEVLSRELFTVATKCSILSKENKELKLELEDEQSKKQLQSERDTAVKLKAVAENEFLSLSAKLNFVNKEHQAMKRQLTELQQTNALLLSENGTLHEVCDKQQWSTNVTEPPR